MLYNTKENEFIDINSKHEDNIERVYVDWPETENDEFRYITSRLEEVENDIFPIVFDGKRNDIFQNYSIDQLRFTERVPSNSRFEDHSNDFQHSSVPPLDLISQSSSVEIPGAKGVIDIDLRSSSDSLSKDSIEYNYDVQQNFKSDSIKAEKVNSYFYKEQNLKNNNNPFLNTTLPNVRHSDLILNPGEYDSSRYNEVNPNTTKKPSEIKIPSHETENSRNNATDGHNQRLELEKASFENAKQKYKKALISNGQHSNEPRKANSLNGIAQSKIVKTKPALLTTPLVKQTLSNHNGTDKTTNFIELNKNFLNQQKQINNLSYSSKFVDKNKKECPKPFILKTSSSLKDLAHCQIHSEEKFHNHQNNEKVRINTFQKSSSQSDSKNDYNEYLPLNNNISGDFNNPQEMFHSKNSPNFPYAYNQYGDPIITNPDNKNSKRFNSQLSSSQNQHNFHPPYNMTKDFQSISASSNNSHRVSQQEFSKSNDSDYMVKDPPYKRQPTLYDEILLNKKLNEVQAERSGSRFPPILHSSDSSKTLYNSSSGYAANFRQKAKTYEQYTLRDFQNIKHIDRGGGLGPNIGSESYIQLKEKIIRQKNYAKAVHEKNQEELFKQNEQNKKEKTTNIQKEIDNNSLLNETESVKNDEYDVEIDSVNSKQYNDQQSEDNKRERTSSLQPKLNLSSAKEQMNKRELMQQYAKSIQEKQIKKKDSKSQIVKAQSANSNKEMKKNPFYELIDNSELDRLVQRHENDKKMANQIRQQLGKIS